MNERIFDRILAGRTVSNLEFDNCESNTLESVFSPTFYEVHHQNVKHQQRHCRNP
jgi:hypothetical protein